MKVKSLVVKIVSCVFMALVVTGTVIGNKVAWNYELQADAYLNPPISDDVALSAASEEGQALAAEIVQNGSVLLENRNGVLPLDVKKDRRINVFGYGAADWSFGALGGGTSGMVRAEDDDTGKLVDLLRALTRYGISYNSDIIKFYKNWCEPLFAVKNPGAINRDQRPLTVCDPAMSAYPQDLLQKAKDYSDVAVVVISRTACEARDMTGYQLKRGPGQSDDSSRTYLQISTEEEELLTYVGANYDRTIVILNVANAMECGFMDTIEGLDALMYVGLTGTRAASAIPALLYGEVSPSGKTADTYPYTTDTSPAGIDNWFGYGNYSNPGYDGWGTDYVEGIYVGYKWYETADHCHVWDSVENAYGKGYEAVVQYPFGYGLSYTTFDWTVTDVSSSGEGTLIETGDKITVEVNVTNTGDNPGKDVVQAYVTVPYTPDGIEKSYVSLVGFAKTATLIPGASQTIKVEIDVNDFLSYDCYDKNGNGFKGYELEQGIYEVKLMTDAHTVKEIYTVENGVTSQEKTPAVFRFEVAETVEVRNDPVTGEPVVNLFTGDDAIDGFSLDGIENDYNANIPFMSRNDFKDGYTIPVRTDAVKYRKLNQAAADAIYYSAEKATAWDNAEVDAFGDPVFKGTVTWGKSGDLRVADANGNITELGFELGANYGDERWQQLLDQVTFGEAFDLIGPAMSGNNSVGSVGKPRLMSYDSIIQMKGFAGSPRGTGNPSTVLLAQTFDANLMYRFGLGFGAEMKSLGVQSVFGPGVNIHRSAYSGRNFEYLSEDTFLTSVGGCMMVRGIQNRGCGVELKHFVLNELEAARFAVGTWVSEQALREIYLPPFRKAVVNENCSGIMTSYNGIGTQWTGGSTALLTGVLRKEWKFKGWVDTDWTDDGRGYKGSIDEQLRAGGDLGMAAGLNTSFKYSYSQKSSSPRLQMQMREAVHHVLYGWLTTKTQEKNYVPEEGTTNVTAFIIDSWRYWPLLLTTVDLIVAFGCAIWLLMLFFPIDRKKNVLAADGAPAADSALAVEEDNGGEA